MAIESAALFLIAATVADELLSSETRPTIQFFLYVWFFDPSRDQPLPPQPESGDLYMISASYRQPRLRQPPPLWVRLHVRGYVLSRPGKR